MYKSSKNPFDINFDVKVQNPISAISVGMCLKCRSADLNHMLISQVANELHSCCMHMDKPLNRANEIYEERECVLFSLKDLIVLFFCRSLKCLTAKADLTTALILNSAIPSVRLLLRQILSGY